MFLNQSQEFTGNLSFGAVLTQTKVVCPLSHFWQLQHFKVVQLLCK